MRNLLLIASFSGAVMGCAGMRTVTPGDTIAANRSQSQTQLAADREEFGARARYLCGDPVLDDQAVSGGESLTHGGPCWQPNLRVQEAALKHQDSAVSAQRAAFAIQPDHRGPTRRVNVAELSPRLTALGGPKAIAVAKAQALRDAAPVTALR